MLLLAAQQPISRRFMERAVGTEMEIMIEEYDADICMYLGRAQSQAPEVDGVTYVSSSCSAFVGANGSLQNHAGK